jgi:hypothetical protein
LPAGRRADSQAATSDDIVVRDGIFLADHPPAIAERHGTVTDAQGRRAVYVPIRIGGKIVVPAPAAQ